MKYLALLTTLFCVSSVQAEEEAKWWFDTAEYWQEWDARESETCEQELDKDDFLAIVEWRQDLYKSNYELLTTTLSDLIELDEQLRVASQEHKDIVISILAEQITQDLLPPMMNHLSDELTRLGNNPPGLEVFPTPELARQRCHEIFHAAKHETQSVQALVRIELEQIEPEMIGYHNAVFRAKLRVKFEASQAPSPQ